MLSERIREARKALGITQAQLAEKIGVKHPVISKYETGQIVPSLYMLQLIARELHVSTNWLMNGQTLERRDQAMTDYVARRFDEPAEGEIDITSGTFHKTNIEAKQGAKREVSDDFMMFQTTIKSRHSDELGTLYEKLENHTISEPELKRFDLLQNLAFKEYDELFKSPEGLRLLNIIRSASQEEIRQAIRVLEALFYDNSGNPDK